MVIREDFVLSNSKISEISAKCYDFYKKCISEKRQYSEIGVTLFMEETLIHLQSVYGEDAECSVFYKRSIFGSKVEFVVPGNRIDPLASKNEELEYSRHILQSYGIAPNYRYNNNLNANEITIDLIQEPI